MKWLYAVERMEDSERYQGPMMQNSTGTLPSIIFVGVKYFTQ